MDIDIRGNKLQISDALRNHVGRKLGVALYRFRERIGNVTVRLTDLNGPRGGIDKRCSIVVIHAQGGTTVVHADSDDAYAAVTIAAARLDEQVARRVHRAWPSGSDLPQAELALVPASAPLFSIRDAEEIRRMIELAPERDRDAADALEAELYRACVVPAEELPADVVALDSRVRFCEETTGQEREITLVRPREADVARGRVSVLAPVGAALIGLRVGDVIDWPLPGGRPRRFRIIGLGAQDASAPLGGDAA